MNLSFVPFVVLALALQIPTQKEEQRPGGILFTVESEGLLDDLVVIQAIRSTQKLLADSSRPLTEFSKDDLDGYCRTVLALREVAKREIVDAQTDIQNLIENCDARECPDLMLDAFVALHALGKPKVYFMTYIDNAKAQPFRAAGALLALAVEPTEELLAHTMEIQILDEQLNGDLLGHNAFLASRGQLRKAVVFKDNVKRWRKEGQLRTLDESLLINTSDMLVAGKGCGEAARSPRIVHSPCGRIAYSELKKRILEDKSTILGTLREMTYFDKLIFLEVGESDDPAVNKRIDPAQNMRNLFLEAIPELP